MDIGIATFAIAQGMASYTSFLPKLTDVRKATSSDRTTIADVRIAEMGATVLAVGIGAMVSIMAGSKVPFIITCIMALTVIALYESVLRSTPVEDKPATVTDIFSYR